MRPVLFIICLGLVSGCARFTPEPLAPAQTADHLQSRSLSDAGLQIFIRTNAPRLTPQGWPPRTWDLPLLTCAAFYYNPEMEGAQARLAAAQAAITSAGARPNPTFVFLPTYSGPPLEFFSPWTYAFSLDAPIETAGKRGYRLQQARHLANAANLDAATTAWRVRSRVRSTLLELRGATWCQELLTNQDSLQRQIVGLLEDQQKLGQISPFEVQTARVAQEQTTLQLRDAQKQTAQAKVRLAGALGISVDSMDGAILSYSVFDQPPRFENARALRRQALLHRSDILCALSEYEASQSALQLEIARQYPDIHLGPGYTWNQSVNNYSLGLTLTVPALNHNQGPIAEAQAHRRESAAAFLALQTKVLGEVDAAFAGYRDALQKLETADALLTDLRARVRSAQASFDAGASDRLELLSAQLELAVGQLARANAFVEMQQAVGALEDALQRPADAALEGQSP
jgi:outer membrane protein TolC